MPTERDALIWRRLGWGEGLVLLAITPFLLFPTFSTAATLAALILVILIWLRPLWNKNLPVLRLSPFNVSLLAFCLAVLVGILVTADPRLTYPKATGLILGITLWRYLVMFVLNANQVNWAVVVMLLAGLGYTFVGLLNADWLLKAYSNVPVLGNLPAVLTPIAGIAGGVIEGVHPNQIAGTIMLYLPLLAALLMQRPAFFRRGWLTAALIISLVFALLALALSQSRSGWLGFAAAAVFMLFIWMWQRSSGATRRGLLVALICLLLVLAAGLFWIGSNNLLEIWQEPPQQTAVGSLSTLNFRKQIWPWAITAVSDFPFTGTGLGSFRQVVFRLYPIDIPVTEDIAHAHNIFLQVALDIGLPGLIAYLSLVGLAFMIGWQIMRRKTAFQVTTLGLLGCLLAFHVYGFVDTVALGAKPTLLLWFNLGIIAAMNQAD